MRSLTLFPNDFKTGVSNEESCYDVEYDKQLIAESIAKQYHILPSQQDDLSYSDWSQLVSGLMDDTPLGRIVTIRCETDKERIKRFTPHEKAIRTEWARFKAGQKLKASKESQMKDIEIIQNMIRQAFA